MDELIAKIKEYLAIINKQITEIDEDLIDFCICEVIDRTQLYLNSESIPKKVERILANIVNNGLKKCLKNIEVSEDDKTEIDRAVKSISDNGQSISYANEITKYFTNVTDDELFTGFNALLSRYRRIKVVHPKVDDKRNS